MGPPIRPATSSNTPPPAIGTSAGQPERIDEPHGDRAHTTPRASDHRIWTVCAQRTRSVLNISGRSLAQLKKAVGRGVSKIPIVLSACQRRERGPAADVPHTDVSWVFDDETETVETPSSHSGTTKKRRHRNKHKHMSPSSSRPTPQNGWTHEALLRKCGVGASQCAAQNSEHEDSDRREPDRMEMPTQTPDFISHDSFPRDMQGDLNSAEDRRDDENDNVLIPRPPEIPNNAPVVNAADEAAGPAPAAQNAPPEPRPRWADLSAEEDDDFQFRW